MKFLFNLGDFPETLLIDADTLEYPSLKTDVEKTHAI